LDGQGQEALRVLYLPFYPNQSLGDSIEIHGLTEEPLRQFRSSNAKAELIRISTQRSSAVPSLFGRFEVGETTVTFLPKFALQPGLPYYVEIAADLFSQSALSAIYVFELPKPDQKPVTVVQAVFPSASELPANLLKLYLHFSQPMSVGDVYSHIQLLDTHGKALELPFLELGEELWDPDALRLTLLFDPGRIKRGLKPNLDEGSVLQEGENYTLLIHDTMLDAKGRRLLGDYRKRFTASAPDMTSPNPYNWTLEPPKPGTLNALSVTFPEPLDEALLQRVVSVVDDHGHEIFGTVSIAVHETVWSFTPDSPWRSGTYKLQAQTILEDLAGNSIARPFEVDASRPSEGYPETKYVFISFRVQ
jgi:hypothetical protein